MTDTPPGKPRRPKLRSSCNECGIAKLKCDRGSPQCGRCSSLGLDCVYGVSRKMGKPPRERIRMSALSGVTQSTDDQANAFDGTGSSETACSNGGKGAIGNALASDPALHPTVNNMPLPWDAFEGYATNFMADFDTAGTSNTNLLGLSLPDLTCVDTTWPIYHSPRVEGDPIPSTQTKTLLAGTNENSGFEDTVSAHSTGTDHDCGPEAYDVLNSLSSPRFNQAHPTALPAHFQPTSNTWNSHHAPFDQILRLNRESSDRLGRLLTCSCARRPHLGFLYASIITLILTLYQQAAGCSQTNLAMDPSLPGSESPWSNKMSGTINARESGTTTLNKAVAFAPQPAQITMGSFKIDDQEVKAALTIQLLLGEIKHAGRLINLLRLRSSSDIDGVPFDSVDNLYRSLRTWLGSEHSRLVETLKSRLQDIST